MKTHLIILADRSGSMMSMRSDAEGGMRSMVEEARDGEGDCLVSIIYFDSQDPHEVYLELTPVEDVITNAISLQPRGSTPLLDAIGRAITFGRRTEEFVDATMLAIFTDGYENASTEFKTTASIRALVEQAQDDGWLITFAGANMDAFAVAGDFGVYRGGTVTYTSDTSHVAYQHTKQVLRSARAASAAGVAFNSVVER